MKSKFAIGLIFILSACVSAEKVEEQTQNTADQALKDAFKGDFYIGAALNYDQVYDQEDSATALIKKHFNSITPENLLKISHVHPKQDSYNFDPADKFVAFGLANNSFIVGHTLVWHSQTPNWLFVDDKGNAVSGDTLLLRMKNHINTVVGRYKGKIDGWDVVNEALEDDGTLRKSKWLNIAGEEYISKAYEFAHATDPEAELYYNDYNLWKPAKRDGAIRLVKKLREQGVKIDGIGMQGHYSLHSPALDQIEASVLAFSELGLKVMITELDVDVLPRPSRNQGAEVSQTFEFQEKYNPYTDGLPDSIAEQLSQRYADLFALFYKHRDKISRVTLWGVADKHSWLNNWPIRGRTNYSLLFDRNYQAKEALEKIIDIPKGTDQL